MSFYSNMPRPKLVENSIKKQYKELNEVKEINKINELILIDENKSKLWYNVIKKVCWDFIKENYGFVLIVSLLIILLYVRYIEVHKRKEKIKELLHQIE